jgi:hypothetical protein
MLYKVIDKIDVTRKNFFVFQKKSKILKSQPQLKKVIIHNEIKEKYWRLWKTYGKPTLDWIKIYSGINNKQDYKYVPENYYYSFIEPKLNNRIYTIAYADKNIYDKIIKENSILPKTFLRKINGALYDESYNYITVIQAINLLDSIDSEDLILKPSSESAGGRNVHFMHRTGNGWQINVDIIDINWINRNYPHNFIIQEYIPQHEYFSQFNPTSVNTVRIFTYRSVKDNKVHELHSILRIGKKGSVVDNQASGGISIGIDKNSILNNFAITKYGDKLTNYNDIVFSNGYKIPKLEKMKDLAIKLTPLFLYNHLVAFDFCMDKDSNIRLLEVNLQNIEINFLQMNNGPLFNNFTDEIVEFCSYAQKSVKFDFYV